MDEILLLLFLIVFTVIYHRIGDVEPCGVIEHDFKEDSKLEVCTKCGLKKRR